MAEEASANLKNFASGFFKKVEEAAAKADIKIPSVPGPSETPANKDMPPPPPPAKKEAPAPAASKTETSSPPPAPAAKKPVGTQPVPAQKAAPAATAATSKPPSTGPQPSPPVAVLPEDKWCLAKKNALAVNLERAEREGDINLGLGPEWNKK